jgi:hypothetical protein
MLKPFSKLILFGVLSTTLALSAGSLALKGASGFCGDDPSICVDTGCQAAGGVCASLTENGPCFCVFVE